MLHVVVTMAYDAKHLSYALWKGGMMHLQKVSTNVSQAEMSGNFSLIVNFIDVEGPVYLGIQSIVIRNGLCGSVDKMFDKIYTKWVVWVGSYIMAITCHWDASSPIFYR